jgi:hypothetical protein
MLDKLPPKPECAKPWRDVLPVHAAADLFPLLSKGELEELSRDIKEHGLRQRCHTIDENGRTVLLDGRNRLDALEHIGKEITLDNSGIFEQLPADVDPYSFVISANIHRRHLTGDQKRELIDKLLKATPEKSNRQIAETVKADDKTVGSVRRELEGRAEIPHTETRTDSRGRQQPASKAPKRTAPRGGIEQISVAEKQVSAVNEWAAQRPPKAVEKIAERTVDRAEILKQFGAARKMATDIRKLAEANRAEIDGQVLTAAEKVAKSWQAVSRKVKDIADANEAKPATESAE